MTRNLSDRGRPVGYRIFDRNGQLGEWTMAEDALDRLPDGRFAEPCEVADAGDLDVGDRFYPTVLADQVLTVTAVWAELSILGLDGTIDSCGDAPTASGVLAVQDADGGDHRLLLNRGRKLTVRLQGPPATS